MDLARCDMAEAVAQAFRFSKLVLATPTYNADVSVSYTHLIAGGPSACAYGCLGLGDCTRACKFDAIHVINGCLLYTSAASRPARWVWSPSSLRRILPTRTLLR